MIVEGLQIGDLTDLVIDTISVDQFNSKIEKDAIVVAFFILYRDPARDLNRFIQKSAVDILDTEVSPAPTKDGYYVVFVEMKRDANFPKRLMWIISTLQELTSIDKWYFRSYKHPEATDLTEENLKKYVDTRMPTVKEKIENFFKDTILDSLQIKNNKIVFEKNDSSLIFDFKGYGEPSKLLDLYNLNDKPLKLDESSRQSNMLIRSYLGENWNIEKIEDYYILSNNSDKAVIVKPA